MAILDGDRVVGWALEALLQDTGYKSKFVTDLPPNELKEILAGVEVVILPGDHEGQEERFVNGLISMSTGLGIPVLKLVTAIEEKKEGLVQAISWPCPIENLKQEIEAALTITSSLGENGQY